MNAEVIAFLSPICKCSTFRSVHTPQIASPQHIFALLQHDSSTSSRPICLRYVVTQRMTYSEAPMCINVTPADKASLIRCLVVVVSPVALVMVHNSGSISNKLRLISKIQLSKLVRSRTTSTLLLFASKYCNTGIDGIIAIPLHNNKHLLPLHCCISR